MSNFTQTAFTFEAQAAADKIIAAYLALGIEALWAYGKGGGFWLNANATSPARYVSMGQAKKETRPIQGCELPPEIDETERYLSAYLAFVRPTDPQAPDPIPSDTTDWPAFSPDYYPDQLDYGRAWSDSGNHGGYKTNTLEGGRPMSAGRSNYTSPAPAEPARQPVDLYEKCKEYQVTDVTTLEDFYSRYYKPERYTGRGEEYVKACLESGREHISRHGYAVITYHSSITGLEVTFYPPLGVCRICQKPIPSGDICPACQARKDAYTARRTARVARLQRRAAKKDGEAQGYRKSSDHLAYIMNGQPILIGHHSEKRHRRMIDKMHRQMRKSFDLSKQAEHLRHRAKASEEGRQISSDDPEAILKLKEKLAGLEAYHAEMKRINSLIAKVLGKDKAKAREIDQTARTRPDGSSGYRSATAEENRAYTEIRDNANKAIRELYTAHAADLAKLAGISEARANAFLTPDDLGRIGFCSYQLTNNNAEIRRVKARIAELEKALPLADSEPQVILYPGGVEVTENGPENRLQIRFPAKPAPDIIKQLKGYGFHWSKTQGVWQRMLTNDARWKAEQILGKPVQDTPPEPATIPAEPSTDTPSQLSLL